MDELLNRRLDVIAGRLDDLEGRMSNLEGGMSNLDRKTDGLGETLHAVRGDLIRHIGEVEMRVTTAIHEVLDALRERKSLEERMALLERRLEDMDKRRRDA